MWCYTLIAILHGACVTLAAGQQLVSLPEDDSRFTLYQMPTAFSGPCNLETGPDGHIYVSNVLVNKIGEINPQTGEVKDYDIPWTNPPLPENPATQLLQNLGLNRSNLACAIRKGADGYIYAANGVRNQLARLNTTTKEIVVLTPPGLGVLGNLLFNDLYSGPNGMYFSQTTGNVLTYYEYKTGKFTNFPIPAPGSIPVGVFVASDGNVYVSLPISNKLAKFNSSSQRFTEYPLEFFEYPFVVRAETERRYVWYTGLVGNSLIRFDTKIKKIKVYRYPIPGSFLAEDTVDPNGNVWVSTLFQNNMAFFTPRTETWTRVPFPNSVADVPVGIPPGFNVNVHYDEGTDAIWFTEGLTNIVGRYKLDGTEGKPTSQ